MSGSRRATRPERAARRRVRPQGVPRPRARPRADGPGPAPRRAGSLRSLKTLVSGTAPEPLPDARCAPGAGRRGRVPAERGRRSKWRDTVMPVTQPPSGTVTFLFTDVEGSTRLWQDHPEAMAPVMARHDEIVRDAIESHRGHVVKTTGDGFHAAFATAHDALDAAVAAQRAVEGEPWDGIDGFRVRMGLHTGEAGQRDGDYYGSAVNRAARVMSAAHGGQLVCSQATAELVRDDLADGIDLVDLGEHRLPRPGARRARLRGPHRGDRPGLPAAAVARRLPEQPAVGADDVRRPRGPGPSAPRRPRPHGRGHAHRDGRGGQDAPGRADVRGGASPLPRRRLVRGPRAGA